MLRGTAEFWLGDNALLMGEGRNEILQQHTDAVGTELGEARADASMKDTHRMGRIMHTWEWLSVNSSTVNGMELEVKECKYSIFLC